MATPQFNLELPASFPDSVYKYGDRASGEIHGVVLTKPHVVNLILDLAGYIADKDLAPTTLLEPSCGHGVFFVEAVHRLMRSAKNFGREVHELADSLLAYDIDSEHISIAQQAVVTALLEYGVTETDAWKLARKWVICGDYLLSGVQPQFDYIVGNPPYIRIERLASELQDEYRRRYESLYDRADLYVAFIEKSLNLLGTDGVLSFICADRWILNKYGSPLRKILAERFSVRYYVDLHKASPFDSEVIAYPSIFVITPGETTRVHVAALDTASAAECESIIPLVSGHSTEISGVRMSVYESWFKGDEPWVISTPDNLQALRDLESRFNLLETNGTKVGIGVATGNDRIFIVDGNVDIEADRLVPLVMRADLDKGKIRNSNRFVINGFENNGGLVDLAAYPKLEKYFGDHVGDIQKRHVARKNPGGWFRTIDRVYPQLVRQPKLLIPDIAGSNEVVFDAGHFHPHHNLYFVTSTSWDMEVLGGLLSSKVALFFVWSYAVKMRGSYLRFQAQYLRRIRLPDPDSVTNEMSDAIRNAFRERDFRRLDALSLDVYGIRRLPDFDFVDTRK